MWLRFINSIFIYFPSILFLLLVLQHLQRKISITIHRDDAEEKVGEGEEAKAEGETPVKIWSRASFGNEYRKFNIDMTPKVIKSNLLRSYFIFASVLKQQHCSAFFHTISFTMKRMRPQ